MIYLYKDNLFPELLVFNLKSPYQFLNSTTLKSRGDSGHHVYLILLTIIPFFSLFSLKLGAILLYIILVILRDILYTLYGFNQEEMVKFLWSSYKCNKIILRILSVNLLNFMPREPALRR